MQEIKATLTAAGQFSDPIILRGAGVVYGPGVFDVIVSGDFEGAVTLQVSTDGGESWSSTGDTLTTPIMHMGETATPVLLRAGVLAGADWTGSAVVELRQ